MRGGVYHLLIRRTLLQHLIELELDGVDFLNVYDLFANIVHMVHVICNFMLVVGELVDCHEQVILLIINLLIPVLN